MTESDMTESDMTESAKTTNGETLIALCELVIELSNLEFKSNPEHITEYKAKLLKLFNSVMPEKAETKTQIAITMNLLKLQLENYMDRLSDKSLAAIDILSLIALSGVE